MTTREYFVYRTFDSSGRLLYVGCTKRLRDRWGEHRLQNSTMAEATARCRVQGPYTREVARHIEKEAIRAEDPLYGWTPQRHREKCARDKWTESQINDFVHRGVDPYAAIQLAAAAADEWFPDPYAHTHSSATNCQGSAA